MLTAKRLRELLADLPDDAAIGVVIDGPGGESYYAYEESARQSYTISEGDYPAGIRLMIVLELEEANV